MSQYYDGRYDHLQHTPSSRTTDTPLDSDQESLYTYDKRVTPGRYSDNPSAPYSSRDRLGYPLDSTDPFPNRDSPRNRRSPNYDDNIDDYGPKRDYDANKNYPRDSPPIPRATSIPRDRPRYPEKQPQRGDYSPRVRPRESPRALRRDLDNTYDYPRANTLQRYPEEPPRDDYSPRPSPRESPRIPRKDLGNSFPRETYPPPRDNYRRPSPVQRYPEEPPRDDYSPRPSPRESPRIPRKDLGNSFQRETYPPTRDDYRGPGYDEREREYGPGQDYDRKRSSPNNNSPLVPRAKSLQRETPRFPEESPLRVNFSPTVSTWESPRIPPRKDSFEKNVPPRDQYGSPRIIRSSDEPYREATDSPLPEKRGLPLENPDKWPLDTGSPTIVVRDPSHDFPLGRTPAGLDDDRSNSIPRRASQNGSSFRDSKRSVNGPRSKPESEMKGSYMNPAYDKTDGVTVVKPDGGRNAARSSREKKQSKGKACGCCSYRVLIVIIVLLLIFGIVMMALFIYRATCCKATVAPIGEKNETKVTPSAQGCILRPNPVPLSPLPAAIVEELRKLEEKINEGIRNKKATALSANVVYRDQVIWAKGFGVMDQSSSTKTTPTPDTVYPCASISKMLTALALFKQYENRKIEFLYDPVTRYAPTFSVKNPFNSHKITLEDLAVQTSGLPREGPCFPPTNSNLCPFDYTTMLRRISNISVLIPPGTVPQYSNLGFGLLGQVIWNIDPVGTSSFGKWMIEKVFKTLGISNSFYSPTQSQKNAMPVGHTKEYAPIVEWGFLDPGGGLFSSVNDLAKLEIELMSDKEEGRFLNKHLTKKFFEPVFSLGEGKNLVGYSFEIERIKNYQARTKGGYIFGYSSTVAMVPELRLGFNIMCTDCYGKLGSTLPGEFRNLVTIFHEVLTNETRKKYNKPPDARPYVGRYNSTVPVIDYMEVKEESDRMILAFNGFDAFIMDYTRPLVFKLTFNDKVADCFSGYTLGINGEMMYFDPYVSRADGLSPGFLMYAVDPSGRSYFTRS